MLQSQPQPTTTQQLLKNKQLILHNLITARQTMQGLSMASEISPASIQHLTQIVCSLIPHIHQYLNALTHQLVHIQNVQLIEAIIQYDADNKAVGQKITMYIWQVLNFICIKEVSFPDQLLSLLSPLLRFDLKYQAVQTHNSLKNGLIFYHNLLAKFIKQRQHFQKIEAQLISLFCQIVASHFNHQNQSQSNQLFCSPKPEATLLSEMEWIGFIFMQFFNTDLYSSKNESFIKKAVDSSQDGRIIYYVLHMIGNYFQEMVDKRITTELVSGFECQINDVKNMYSGQQNCLVKLKISRYELDYIFRIFKQEIVKYKEIVRKYLKLKLSQEVKKEQQAQVDQKWLRNTEILTEVCHIFNNVLFIGGYNNKLQDVVIASLMEQDELLLSYLELSYLLYRNIQSTRYKSKVGLLVEMEMQAKKKLMAAVALEMPLPQIQQIQIKDLILQKILAPGQLVSILRLLANLVHINHRSQLPFEKNTKYLHMILSLTHDSVSQATMKQWAIMFIRNVSEWSATLREEIGKINMQMKVE